MITVQELWTVRFFEAVVQGCIPVLIGPGIRLPFESQIDYRSISVKVRGPEILSASEPEHAA